MVNGPAGSLRQGEPIRYPLQRSLFKAGCLVGLLAGALSASLIVGFSLAVALWLAGLLWRENELPVQLFCVLYQWVFVVTGYYAYLYYGYHPAQIVLGDIEAAVALSLIGLLVVSVGIRTAMPDSCHRHPTVGNIDATSEVDYDPKKLFWIVICLFTVNWVVETFPMAILFDAAQLIHSIFLFRYLFLLLLLMVIVRQRMGYQYGVLAFFFVLMPELTSSMAKFKDVFFMVLIVFLAYWKPWSKDLQYRARNRQIFAISVGLCVVILAAGLIWTGGMKGDWRTALRTGAVSGSPIEKIEEFGRHLDRSIQRFDSGSALQAFLARLSSSEGYFSRVLTIVPERVPHEDGTLTWRAIHHILTPRILFPEKKNLGGDSWLVRKYAGVQVAGDESFTSVGLGYMAEFYIDYGEVLMFVPLFLLGLLIGSMQRIFTRISPSSYIAEAAVTGLLVQYFIGYGSHLTKMLGGLLQSTAIFVIFIAVAGSWLHAYMQFGNAGERAGRFKRNLSYKFRI
jgi:hypothetical protein